MTEVLITVNKRKKDDARRMGKTGNGRSSKAVRGPNLYASEYGALAALLATEGRRIPKLIYEPHAGTGALVNPLRQRGFEVVASDLHDWGLPGVNAGVDFLMSSQPAMIAAMLNMSDKPWGIVGNPPYEDPELHVERAVRLSGYVAFLFRLAFLESEGRRHWFRQVGLQRVHLISDRLPMMHRHDFEGDRSKERGSGMAFAWYIFEPEKRRRVSYPVRLVSWKESCKRYPKRPTGDDPVDPKALPTLFDARL